MFKSVVLLKRKPGTTLKEFIDYYETTHAPLGVKYQTKMKRYIRHFFHPAPYPLDGVKLDPEYDVMTELWFDDRQDFDDGMALMLEGEANRVLGEDERRFMDVTKARLAFVEEYESEMPGKNPNARTDTRCFALLKRKPGTTMEQFIDHYENHHQYLGLKYSGEMLSRYRRLYLHPAPYPLDGSIVEAAYDVATEVSFDAGEAMKSGVTAMADPETNLIIEADEEKFVDRTTRRFVMVESHESVLPWMPESAQGEFVRSASA